MCMQRYMNYANLYGLHLSGQSWNDIVIEFEGGKLVNWLEVTLFEVV